MHTTKRERERAREVETRQNGLFYFCSSQWSKSLRHEQMISKICVSIYKMCGQRAKQRGERKMNLVFNLTSCLSALFAWSLVLCDFCVYSNLSHFVFLHFFLSEKNELRQWFLVRIHIFVAGLCVCVCWGGKKNTSNKIIHFFIAESSSYSCQDLFIVSKTSSLNGCVWACKKKQNSECCAHTKNSSIRAQTPMRGEDEQPIALGRKIRRKNLFIRKRENEKKRSLPKVARLTEDIPLSQI